MILNKDKVKILHLEKRNHMLRMTIRMTKRLKTRSYEKRLMGWTYLASEKLADGGYVRP